MTPAPNSGEFNTATAAIITWGRIELYVWFGIVVSNIFFNSASRAGWLPVVFNTCLKNIYCMVDYGIILGTLCFMLAVVLK